MDSQIDGRKDRRRRFGLWTDLGDVGDLVGEVGEAGELLAVEEAREHGDGEVDVLDGEAQDGAPAVQEVERLVQVDGCLGLAVRRGGVVVLFRRGAGGGSRRGARCSAGCGTPRAA